MTANLRTAGHWCKVAGPFSSADWEVCYIGLDPKPNLTSRSPAVAARRSPHLGLLTIDDSPLDQLHAHGLMEELEYRVQEGLGKGELQFCAHGLGVGVGSSSTLGADLLVRLT